MMKSFAWCRWCTALLWLLALASPATAQLVLDDSRPRVDAWPAVSVLVDTTQVLTLADVRRASQPGFAPPPGAHATLGLNKAPVWLRIPLQVDARSDGEWILGIDYAVLNRVDVHVVGADGLELRHARLGNLQPYAERPLPGRIHAVALRLPPGQPATVYLRVQTQGAMVLPITLEKLPAFQARSLDEQMLQGLLTGLGLCLLLYSLMQWGSLRERLYLKYALQSGGSILFSIYQFGFGKQYLWGDNLWAELHLGGISALLAAAGTFLFVDHALGPHPNRWFGPMMKGGCAVLLAVAVAYGVDLLHVHQVSAVVGTLGLAPAIFGMPGALKRARRGDPVGWLFLAAWVGYFVATWVMVSLIKGTMPFNFWTQHSLQFGATLDMLLFMRVIGVRQQELHAAAQRARQERESLVTLARTDALTGLPNRRGLDHALEAALAGCAPDRLVALYLLDLDGFKVVNDAHGHQVGDELLVAVGRRLRHVLRPDDVSARLGGDEFVVIAGQLADDEQARRVGQHLLDAFEEPFALSAGTGFRLGVTIGYVLAPLDGRDAAMLMRRADGAMYAGKQGGKRCVRRAQALAA
ncbi:diguanylate cyclase [Piscinibacter sp. XHJ-5]|uniref:diguanylate cyclase n=1 Tax=Piscinibacter sp. XHJ-5 TaxID=3037797 RepID=UPI002452C562|nr:diguanylate cyclase [Piscinibacter sp. XHJ-5]